MKSTETPIESFRNLKKREFSYSARAIFLCVLASLLLLPQLKIPKWTFLYDDASIFNQNTLVKNQDYKAIWSSSYWEGDGRLVQKDFLFRPIFLTLSSALQNHACILRLCVVFSHIGVSSVLLLLLLRGGASWAPAALLAAFFALTPLHVEVTSQVIGLMETIPLLCGLLGFFFLPGHPWISVGLISLTPGFKETG